jgi:hypothetical protein
MPLSIRGPHSYGVEIGPDADRPVHEWDHYNCNHCGRMHRVEVKSYTEVRCKRCFGVVGPCCEWKGTCNPTDNLNLEDWLHKKEEENRKLNDAIRRGLV